MYKAVTMYMYQNWYVGNSHFVSPKERLVRQRLSVYAINPLTVCLLT